MKANVVGRVRNISLPRSHGLLPLFEAIVNSVDAIEDATGDSAVGTIEVRILRAQTPLLDGGLGREARTLGPISGFVITDDGIGFTEKNYAAFNEADTQAKADRGGKGVGRFVWLRAFSSVEIDSIYRDGPRLQRRTFLFSQRTDDGITNHRVEVAPADSVPLTVVRLVDFKPEYRDSVPKTARAVAQRIVEHCLQYFLLGNMPRVRLVDVDGQDAIDLDSLYDELVDNAVRQELEIGESKFHIAHFLLHGHANLDHHISYCASRRTVKLERLSNKVNNLPPSIPDPDGDGHLIYAGYVASDYLDSRVNQQRTNFDLMSEAGLPLPGELSWGEIEEEVLAASREFLRPFTEKARAEKNKRLHDFVSTKAPQYRHVLRNHPDRIESIPVDVSDDVLDTKLHEISREIEVSLKVEAAQLLAQGVLSDDECYEAKLGQFSRFWDEFNEVGKANLAKYIAHRKLILSMLGDALKRQNTGKYSREEVIHKLVFPLRTTSDEIAYDKHNLWIIDEKLAYHHYLASDVPLNKVEQLECDSASRADLLLFFDKAIAVVEEDHPFTSGIVIFEFKRPMRDDYSDSDHPIQQVWRYVEEIKAGKVKTKDGRPFRVPPQTPFYCYIVCDPSPRLEEQARFAGLRRTPDGDGYFGYNTEVGAYTEVIGFEKLVSDAHKRNRVLFGKLGMLSETGSGGNGTATLKAPVD